MTPRKHCPILEDGATAWAQKRARETTPDRALRKMQEKIKRSLDKADRGEHERIVAVCEQGEAANAGATSSATPAAATSHCPAQAQLDNPAVLSHLRSAFEFLGTCKLHYCENCDEEWPVFDEEKWPDGGVSCAGRKAGTCETVARAGWRASSTIPGLCSRCSSATIYRKMYSKENLQHLGERHEALSQLTWYESLLIARVHPVVSVITMTASGMLCYAGHVINYFVKVNEWISDLPARLRDKRWFLVKRRKSIRASGAAYTTHKKPTTANRQRLMAAIAAVQRYMPKVYEQSVVVDAELEKFPVDGEREMLEQDDAPADLKNELRLGPERFSDWLQRGRTAPDVYPCSHALWHKAVNDLSMDMRRGVTGDVVWEFCCRTLARPEDSKELGTTELAQLLLYWWQLKELPSQFGEKVLNTDMLSDLQSRGKTVETEADATSMQSRWLRLEIQKELEKTLED